MNIRLGHPTVHTSGLFRQEEEEVTYTVSALTGQVLNK